MYFFLIEGRDHAEEITATEPRNIMTSINILRDEATSHFVEQYCNAMLLTAHLSEHACKCGQNPPPYSSI